MVDEGRDTAVGIELCVLRRLLFALLEVEVDALVGQTELCEDEGCLPIKQWLRIDG